MYYIVDSHLQLLEGIHLEENQICLNSNWVTTSPQQQEELMNGDAKFVLTKHAACACASTVLVQVCASASTVLVHVCTYKTSC